MSDLAEAIEHFEQGLPLVAKQDEPGVPNYVRDARTVLDAARRVLEGEQVQWCEEHYSVTWDDWQTENYLYCQRNREGYLGRCSIVPKLLVDV